jgi:hypothetical protein
VGICAFPIYLIYIPPVPLVNYLGRAIHPYTG